MIELNLIPDVKRELLRTKMIRNAVVSMAILIGMGSLAVVVVLGLLFGGQLAAEALQDKGIADKNKSLSAVSDLDKTVTLQHQLRKISEQHGAKSINSRLIDAIGAINPPEPNAVRFSSVSLDPEKKTIKVEGSAKNGYIALEILKKTITNTHLVIGTGESSQKIALAQDLMHGDTSFGEDTEGKKVLRFTFSFVYPDELFKNTRDSLLIEGPRGRIDVTDSRLGIPESLFAKKPADKPNQQGGN